MDNFNLCRACEIYGPDEHPCCEELGGECMFLVEDTRDENRQCRYPEPTDWVKPKDYHGDGSVNAMARDFLKQKGENK